MSNALSAREIASRWGGTRRGTLTRVIEDHAAAAVAAALAAHTSERDALVALARAAVGSDGVVTAGPALDALRLALWAEGGAADVAPPALAAVSEEGGDRGE